MDAIKNSARSLINSLTEWEPRLRELSFDIITTRRNSQSRTIKQIIGHLIDSAANNHQRIVRLQYTSRLHFPDYQPDNDTWIALQMYQEKDWHELTALWKHYNLHIAYIIQSVNPKCLRHEWSDGFINPVTLEDIITGYPQHFRLHLCEIQELMEK